jgi:hypothetical protein
MAITPIPQIGIATGVIYETLMAGFDPAMTSQNLEK